MDLISQFHEWRPLYGVRAQRLGITVGLVGPKEKGKRTLKRNATYITANSPILSEGSGINCSELMARLRTQTQLLISKEI